MIILALALALLNFLSRWYHTFFFVELDDARMSAEEMDLRRKENTAYEYLCHLEEAKV